MTTTAKRWVLALVFLLGLALGAAVVGWNYIAHHPATTQEGWLYIEGDQLSNPELIEQAPIGLVLDLMKWDKQLRAGRLEGAYHIVPGMSALEVGRKLTRRMQDPVKLTFNNIRLKEQWAGRVAEQLRCDSTELLAAMLDPAFLAEAGVDEKNVIGLLLPDTYEVYWTVKPADLMQRMLKEYRRFWNESRLAKVEALDLTPQEATVLCSIAEEETLDRQERGVVAMLYWNRLQLMMPLQADPTVKYAVGDFGLKRILNAHLEVESPYNTYKHAGLPPGPIRMVDKATIDALLNAQMHPYLYMCAKADFSGKHNFATSYSEHLRNAEAYHAALNRMK